MLKMSKQQIPISIWGIPVVIIFFITGYLLLMRPYLILDEATMMRSTYFSEVTHCFDHPYLGVLIGYIYRILADNNILLIKMANIVSPLLTIAILLIIARREQWKCNTLFTLTLASILLAPIFLSGSSVFELETIIYTPLFLATLFMAILFVEKGNMSRYVALQILIFFLFATKITTTKALFIIFPIYLIFQRITWSQKIRKICLLLAMTYIAYALSVVAHKVCLPLLHLSNLSTIMVHSSPAIDYHHLFGLSFWISRIFDLRVIFYWFNPFLLLLFVWVLFSAYRTKKSLDRWEILSITVVITIISGYFLSGRLTASSFPKYIFPVFPFIALFLLKNLPKNIGKLEYCPPLFYLLSGIYLITILIFGDPLLFGQPIRSSLIHNRVFIQQLLCQESIKVILIFFVPSILVFLLARKQKQLFILTMAIIYNIGIASHQLNGIYSIGYSYGEKGMPQVLQYLQEKHIKPFQVGARHDLLVNYYLANHYVPEIKKNEIIEDVISDEELALKLDNPEIEYVILRNYALQLNPYCLKNKEVLSRQSFKLEKAIYDFDVYKRK